MTNEPLFWATLGVLLLIIGVMAVMSGPRE